VTSAHRNEWSREMKIYRRGKLLTLCSINGVYIIIIIIIMSVFNVFYFILFFSNVGGDGGDLVTCFVIQKLL
jgi:hypothetical protein